MTTVREASGCSGRVTIVWCCPWCGHTTGTNELVTSGVALKLRCITCAKMADVVVNVTVEATAERRESSRG